MNAAPPLHPVTAPLLQDVADGPAGGAAFWLTASDGVRIRVAQWGSDAPRGTVLLFPGRTEYIEKYGRAARDLQQRGFATLTIDWRGQGLADRLMINGALGHVGRFSDYQLDIAAMVAHATCQNLPRPWFLLAHSMGGCIGLRALVENLPVAAAAFTAPMWGIQMSAALRPVAWTLSGVSKPLRLSHLIAPGQQAETYVLRAEFAGNDLTNDPEMFDYMRAQLQAHPELAIGGPSLRWLNESLYEMRDLAAQPSPSLPCLTFLGTEETIVDIPRIHHRMARWAGAELVTVPRAKHEIMMENATIRGQSFDRIADFYGRATT